MTDADAALASAVSTFQVKEEVAGNAASAAVGTATSTPSSSPVSENRHCSSAVGAASRSSMAHASSTAIRRSSISSRVKCSRAANPAAAVRSTPR
jgi:hypothetical protein